MAAEFPYMTGEGGHKGKLGGGVAGMAGGVPDGPAMMAASLDGTLTGRESQDSPWADVVRTVSSCAACRDWI